MLGKKPKVIVFTRYRDTMEHVQNQIQKATRYKEIEVVTIYGGLNDAQRREAFQKFEATSRAVLVAMDAISEGMNLQNIASQIIHYELSWNPNRLEQRNGRVDRFGQPEKQVTIRTLVMDETLDAIIMKVLVEKSRQIRMTMASRRLFFGDETNMIELMREHGLPLGPRKLSLFETTPTVSAKEIEDPFSDDVLQRIQDESFYGQTQGAMQLDSFVKRSNDLKTQIKTIQNKSRAAKYGQQRCEQWLQAFGNAKERAVRLPYWLKEDDPILVNRTLHFLLDSIVAHPDEQIDIHFKE